MRWMLDAGLLRDDRRSLTKRHGSSPYAFEAVKVEGGHLAAVGSAQAEHGCPSGWDAVGVLVDQELVIGAVDRVIQHGAVEPDLDVLDRGERLVKHQGIA